MLSRAAALRPLIGGRWAVSLLGYLLLAPISLIWIFTTVPEAFLTSSQWMSGILVGLTSYLVTGVVLWLASITVLRNRTFHPARISTVVLIGAGAWGARSTCIGWFIDAMDLPSEANIAMRTITGAIGGAVIVPGTAWLLANLEAFRSSRRELLRTLVDNEIRAEHAQTYLDVMREAVVSDVRSQVTHEFSLVPASPSDPTFRRAVDTLSDRMTRDLPRTLWRDAKRDSHLHVAQVLSAAALRPLAIWPLPVMAITALLVLARFYSFGNALTALAPTITWAVATALAVNAWAARTNFPRHPAIPLIIGAALMALSGLVLFGALTVAASEPIDAPAFSFLVGMTFTLFSLGAGVARGVAVSHHQTRDHLRASISASEIRQAALEEEQRRLQREIATTLHGTVSANLTAASMRLRQAIDDGDKAWALEALHEARRMVDLELSTRTEVENLDLRRLIEENSQAWAGLVTITGSVGEALQISAQTYRALDDVLTEGINNAVRHGRAQAIHITIQRNDDDLIVTVADDGVSSNASSAGLGARIFDSIAPGAWTRTASEDHGTKLSLRIKESVGRFG